MGWLLLPQPHGFEGFGAVAELVNAQDPAVVQRVDLIQPLFDPEAASRPRPWKQAITSTWSPVPMTSSPVVSGSYSQASIQRA